ncbi:MAG: 4-(cytidine 5'-diphospho)-2-C-methyl-D-erythritol kinase [Eubacteriales bacterium]
MVKKEVVLYAPAKINLALAITGRRKDGFHELQTIFQSVSLYDFVRVEVTNEEGITCVCGALSGEKNLAFRAAKIFLEELGKKTKNTFNFGIKITIHKRIPLQAGLAGGSSDAATVFRALNIIYDRPFTKWELLACAKKCGSDTAYCLFGGTYWGEGTGVILSELPAVPQMNIIIVKPEEGMETGEAYRLFDEFGKFSELNKEQWEEVLKEKSVRKLGSLLVNVLEPVSIQIVPKIGKIKNILLEEGCYGGLMSGSGSSVFGILPKENNGLKIMGRLKKEGFNNLWLVKSIGGNII